MADPEPVTLTTITNKVMTLGQQPGAGALLEQAKQAEGLVADAAQASGFKSSEFALTLLVALSGLAFCAAQLYQGKMDMATAGVFMGVVLKVANYTRGRVALKSIPTTPPSA